MVEKYFVGYTSGVYDLDIIGIDQTGMGLNVW